MSLANQLTAKLHKAVLDQAIEQTVGALARHFLIKPQPFPGSEQISQQSAEQLQPRTNTPDVPIGNLPHWGGVQDAVQE